MDLLKRLNIQPINSGAFSGHAWESSVSGHCLASFNPANGEKLGDIGTCSMQDYEHVIASASQAFLTWREVPAPQTSHV